MQISVITNLGSIDYCYVHLFNLPHSPLLPSNVLSPHLYFSVLTPHGIIGPSKIGIKVSVSTLRRDSQRPEYAYLPMCGTLLFFLEEF